MKPRSGSARTGASILGAHVEGPFINESRAGAHSIDVLRSSAKNGLADIKDVYGLDDDSSSEIESIKLFTCAPELEGVADCIPDLVKAGITVSIGKVNSPNLTVEDIPSDIAFASASLTGLHFFFDAGHSMANISQAEKAVTNGATFIAHLFNAMPQFHHRDPGVIGLLGSRMDLPRPFYGLICDGMHVHPNSVKIAYDSHPDGVILCTAMSPLGLEQEDEGPQLNAIKYDDLLFSFLSVVVMTSESSFAAVLVKVICWGCINMNNIWLFHLPPNCHPYLSIHSSPSTEVSLEADPEISSTFNKASGLRIDLDKKSPPNESHRSSSGVEHNEGSLPTPPGSTPLSPLKMTVTSPSFEGVDASVVAEAVQKQLLPPQMLQSSSLNFESSSSLYFSTASESHEVPWMIKTVYTHSPEYDEHDAFTEYEEFEGAGHSLRIITLHITDSDDDDLLDGGSLSLSDGSAAAFPLPPPRESFVVPATITTADVATNTTASIDDNGFQHDMEMTDCSCKHHVQHVIGSDRGSQKGPKSSSTSPSVRTQRSEAGDLCCASSSVITMDACIRNFIEITSCSVIEALEAVTLHPAVMLGIQNSKGVIQPGADADLVFLSEDLFVKRVFVAGEEVMDL